MDGIALDESTELGHCGHWEVIGLQRVHSDFMQRITLVNDHCYVCALEIALLSINYTM